VRRRAMRIAGLTGALATLFVLAGTATAWADSAGADFIPAKLEGSDVSFNLLWIVIGAVLVIFMQAGFALVETGFCRAKHAAHVVSTNFAIFGLGFVAFYLVGYGIMFGGYTATIGADGVPVIGTYLTSVGHYIGNIDGFGAVFAWASPGLSGKAYDVGVMAFFLYMVAFMDTVATIPTGAMAERWKWKSFIGWGLFCGAIYYPLFGMWTWGGGWLSQLGNNFDLGNGYVDFAGSGVVHMMGGTAALMGAIVLGPRIGKYGPDGKPRTLAAHHIPMAMLGCFILLFGWFGFNAASTLAATDPRFTVVAANTAIAGAFGSIIAMFWVMLRTGKPDPGMMVNGMLAGLVAITAPCAFVQPWAAAVIGCIAGVVVIEAFWVIERKFKIDDPVGAIAVHGVCGMLGVLSVGIFADGKYGAGWNATGNAIAEPVGRGITGILYDFSDGAGQLAAQAIGAATILVIMGGIVFTFFKVQNALTKGGIRSEEADEIAGLDLPEMGVYAYPEFEHVIHEVEYETAPLTAGASAATVKEGTTFLS
jgi:ammonium transporter, Amt family